MPDHTAKQFDAELEVIRSQVLKMGGMVEEQFTRAIEALTDGNSSLAQQVVSDDYNINSLELQIDEDCSSIIARRQPAAKDLRMIMTVVKIITDLERIGDEASKIARMTASIYGSDRAMVPRTYEIQLVADTSCCIRGDIRRNALIVAEVDPRCG